MTAEERIFWHAVVLGLSATALVITGAGAVAGVALAVGIALSLGNFAWLRRGVVAIQHAAVGGTTASLRGGAVRFVLRIGLLLGCLCAIFISHLLSMIWVVAGLFAVPAAALVVAVVELVRSARHA